MDEGVLGDADQAKLGGREIRTAILGGMASYLDAATIVSASIGFVMYGQAGFGLGPAEMGILSATLTFGLAIGAVIGGRLGDLFGRRRTLVVDLVVLTAGLACLTFAPDIRWLFPGAIAAGLAMGADLPVSISLVAEQGPLTHRGRLVSITNLLWLVGIAASIVTANVVGLIGLAPLAGARVMFGHVLVVAVVVWVLRLGLPESAEWRAATGEGADPGESSTSGPTRLRELRPHAVALLATGGFYLLWNLQANTTGQFNAYLFTETAGGDLRFFNLIGLIMLPVGFLAGLIALKVIDTRWRRPAYLVAAALTVLVLVPPAVFGISVATLLPMLIVPGLLAPFSGESFYKIWTQEMFPTRVRSTAQGASIFFCRFFTALFALGTPLLAHSHPSLLYGVLAVAAAGSMLIGWLWIPALNRSVDLQPTRATVPAQVD